MGKSAGKWIRAFLSGKKTTRSNSSKRREALKTATQKGLAVGKASTASAVDSSVISEPVFNTTSTDVVNSELESRASEALGNNDLFIASANPVLEKNVRESGTPTDPENFMNDLAAKRVQAAFRGYLARRAFGALKGIIRLQALIRGHLVRRQAVATLYSLQGIIKFQALVRGLRVRSSGIGLEVSTKFPCSKAVVKSLNSKKKLCTNAFINRLVSSPITRIPLRTQYIQCEPNSVYSWLERWTASLSLKQAPQARKNSGSKPQSKKTNYAMETESGRSKRGVRQNSISNIDPGSSMIGESEKPKRSLRKFSSSVVDSVAENPQSELEKVKRNLRKVSNSMAENSSHIGNESDKSSPSLKKLAVTHVSYQNIENSVEQLKDDVVLTFETKQGLETESKSMPQNVIDVPCNDHCFDEVHPLQTLNDDDAIPMMNGGASSKEDQTLKGNPKSSKRRSSFSVKSENEENGVQTTMLPSYMAATESAKAKLRAHNSPRVGSDLVERNSMTRRHSLPSSTNSKSMYSPRTQRLFEVNGKCATKNERVILSSRDGHEKLVQVEWRR